MKTVRVVLIAVILFAMVGLAGAGPGLRTISVFPHVHKVEAIEVPVVTGVDEEQCIVNVTGGECSATVEFDPVNINPLCTWQQDPERCVSGHWEGHGWSKKYVCDQYELASRREWGIHCEDPILLDDIFGDINLTEEEMICNPASVDIDCPEGSVETETTTVNVGYEELVVEAFVGQTIHIRGAVWSKFKKALAYRFMVFKVYPNNSRKLIYRGLRRKNVAGSVLSEEIEYTFTDAGINRIELRLYKPDGTVGRLWTKVMVREREEPIIY